MAIDPEVLRALEGAVQTDPSNRALRLHLIDLLLDASQHAAALGHCEMLLQQSPGDPDAESRKTVALERLGAAEQTPQRERAANSVDDGEISARPRTA